MLKKRILIAGDVGIKDNGVYHIGDEAMLYQNCRLYQDAGSFVSILSHSISHPHLRVNENCLWEINGGEAGWREIQAQVSQVNARSFFSLRRRSARLREYAELLRSHDLIHISGGGNLNSLFPPQLYSFTLLILLAQALGKPVLVTSQTIGPFSRPVDRVVAARALDAAGIVTVRDRRASRALLESLNVRQPRVSVGLDDAFFLESSPADALEQYWLPDHDAPDRLKVGISVHELGDSSLRSIIAEALASLAKQIPLQVYFIPHLVVRQDLEFDVPMMRAIAIELPASIPRRLITYAGLMEHHEPVKERIVKGITGAMDIVITTRYHGLVFALTSGVPALALHLNDYCRVKNDGVLEILFESEGGDYALDVRGLRADRLATKVQWLISRCVETRSILERKRLEFLSQRDSNLSLASELLQVA